MKGISSSVGGLVTVSEKIAVDVHFQQVPFAQQRGLVRP